MNLGEFQRYKSWLLSAGIAVVVGLWLLSGQFGDDEVQVGHTASGTSVQQPARSSVRVRTSSAEEMQRTIVVNGKTAPSRVVQLSAETDGRVEFVDAERGRNIARGKSIVRLDERDRETLLAWAGAIAEQAQEAAGN